MKKPVVKPLDIGIVLFVSAAIIALSAGVYGGRKDPSVVVIRSDEGVVMYPLGEDDTISVEGPIGTTVVEITGGRVRVLSSPCRDKLCIVKGDLVESGDWTACMPNRVFIGIEGTDREAPDAVSY